MLRIAVVCMPDLYCACYRSDSLRFGSEPIVSSFQENPLCHPGSNVSPGHLEENESGAHQNSCPQFFTCFMYRTCLDNLDPEKEVLRFSRNISTKLSR
jgi:hypothetical protein